MAAIPGEDWSKEAKSLDLQHEALPLERALGVRWDVETDMFDFAAGVKEKPMTRRGMLSVVSSIFDPLGFLNPFILPAKRICADGNSGGKVHSVQMTNSHGGDGWKM